MSLFLSKDRTSTTERIQAEDKFNIFIIADYCCLSEKLAFQKYN